MVFCIFQKTGNANLGIIRVLWCPGYAGIEGNELADQLAKKVLRCLWERTLL